MTLQPIKLSDEISKGGFYNLVARIKRASIKMNESKIFFLRISNLGQLLAKGNEIIEKLQENVVYFLSYE